MIQTKQTVAVDENGNKNEVEYYTTGDVQKKDIKDLLIKEVELKIVLAESEYMRKQVENGYNQFTDADIAKITQEVESRKYICTLEDTILECNTNGINTLEELNNFMNKVQHTIASNIKSLRIFSILSNLETIIVCNHKSYRVLSCGDNDEYRQEQITLYCITDNLQDLKKGISPKRVEKLAKLEDKFNKHRNPNYCSAFDFRSFMNYVVNHNISLGSRDGYDFFNSRERKFWVCYISEDTTLRYF